MFGLQFDMAHIVNVCFVLFYKPVAGSSTHPHRPLRPLEGTAFSNMTDCMMIGVVIRKSQIILSRNSIIIKITSSFYNKNPCFTALVGIISQPSKKWMFMVC
mgnify:CR=1 FL=1